MIIKDLLFWTRKAVSAPFVGFFGQRFQGYLGIGRGRLYLNEYRNWVYACVQARSEEVGNIQLKLLKDKEQVEKNELLDLLYKVNPTMTKSDLFFGTQAFLDLEGNAFWFLARDKDGKGKIKEIWLLRPDMVQMVIDESNPLLVKGYVYIQKQGQKIPFDKNEILHFKNFNPTAEHPLPHRGMGVVEASSWAIDADNEARQWNYSFFKNSARPDGFLTKEGQGSISDDEYKRLKLQFSQEHQGSGNAHKVGILSGGLKWQEISKSPKDMDFIEQRRFSRDEILALFRTPKTAIGIVEDVNRANAEATNYIFALRTIKPLMQKIVDTLNEFIVPEFGDGLELDFESPVPADKVADATYYTQAIDKWMTRNEIREIIGLPPSTNGDQIYGSFTLAPIDNVPPQEKKLEPAKVEEKIESKNPIEKVIDKFVAQLPKIKEPPKQLSVEAVGQYKEMWIKSFGVNIEPLKKQLNTFLADQENEVIRNISEELKGLESPEFKYKAVSDLLFDKEKAIRTGISIMTPNIRRYISESGQQANLLTGVADAFDPTTPAIEKFIKERAGEFANTFNTTTAEALLEVLKTGLEENETTAELSERISIFYEGERDYRSDRAARTEVSAGSNFGATEAYQQAGVKEMQWLVVNPEDEDCLANEGEHRAIGEDFPSGDEMPPVHPNCVCTVLPYFG